MSKDSSVGFLSRLAVPAVAVSAVLVTGWVFKLGFDLEPDRFPYIAPPEGSARARLQHFRVGKDQPFAYFGLLDHDKADQLRRNFSMVILEPGNATQELVRYIQSGRDARPGTSDDVIVLGYFSAGEDSRTLHIEDKDLPRGNRMGPRVDPRPGAPFADGTGDLTVVRKEGNPSPGGIGYASYYLDDNDRNGVPDRNKVFGGAFVNAGDPHWFNDALEFTFKRDTVSGLREILTTSYGRGLGCDGVMLDTFDTPIPNAWTNKDSANQSEFEWTASGFKDFTLRLRERFPEKVVLVNRGAAFFNPDLPHYRYTLRGSIDLLLFESFYTDSNPGHTVSPFFPDNRFNYAPRINAEADRADGFKVVTIGYKQTAIASETALVSQLGWYPLVTDGALSKISPPLPSQAFPERQAPTWDSTFATYVGPNPTSVPRVGIQQSIAGRGKVTVQWDLANAMWRPVRYHLYYQPGTALDFDKATKIPLDPALSSAGYPRGSGKATFPYEFTLEGLAPGTYSLAIRAEDGGTPALEEKNRKVLTVEVP